MSAPIFLLSPRSVVIQGVKEKVMFEKLCTGALKSTDYFLISPYSADNKSVNFKPIILEATEET